MKKIITSLLPAIALGATLVLATQLKSEDTFSVLGNGDRGTAEGYPQDALTWYQDNLPTLPLDYVKRESFIAFEPLVHYADHVNWSLFPLKHFKKVSKGRWARVPKGTKIVRDEKTGIWTWPVGAETAKMLGGSVQGANGKMVMEDFELRLTRKLRVDENGKSVWAMATYVKNAKKNVWEVRTPPHLELVVMRALTPSGKVKKHSYSLTAPEGCMTCHSRGSYSNVDYKRGDEFVYGANEELLNGKIRMRLSEYLASPETQAATSEVARNHEEDWIQLEYKDKDALERNRKALQPLFE